MCDQEINDLLATEVMGWMEQKAYWNPVNNIKQAMVVMERILGQDKGLSFSLHKDFCYKGWVAYLSAFFRYDTRFYRSMGSETPARAICLVAVDWAKSRKEKP